MVGIWGRLVSIVRILGVVRVGILHLLDWTSPSADEWERDRRTGEEKQDQREGPLIHLFLSLSRYSAIPVFGLLVHRFTLFPLRQGGMKGKKTRSIEMSGYGT